MTRSLTRFSAWLIYALVIALYAFSLWALFEHRSDETFWSWQQAWQIVKISSLQAALSALFATLLGVLTARSFFYLPFKGKTVLYKLFSFAWALPSLVVIFALIGVWGNSGWLTNLLAAFGIERQFSFYGLHGIIFAHLFLNVPLVTKYCLEGLNLIPSVRHQLAAQLNLQGFRYFQIVELPVLKGILPYAFSTVFLLCFTSFPIVLMLGGSPKYSTLEVAIYQAVSFEFDFAKAVMLILVQVFIGIVLQGMMDLTARKAFEKTVNQKAVVGKIWRSVPKGIHLFTAIAVLIAMGVMILIPIANLLYNGLAALSIERLFTPELWQSLLYSLLISLISSFSVMAIAYLIALEARQLAYHKQKIYQSILSGINTYPLILPIFLLAVGLFLLLMDTELADWQLVLLIGFCNGLTLLPFIYPLIFSAMWQALISHDKLAQSLGLKGFRRWWIVEKNALIRPLAQAFALSMSAGLGSFAVIAFFGSPDFSTLPYLLYLQLGSYRNADAAVTALLLTFCTLLPFLMIKQKETL